MIRFFVSVALPSIMAYAVAASILSIWAGRRLRAYRAERQAAWRQRRALRQAQDALAAVIADSLASQDTRDAALPAYEVLGRLVQEGDTGEHR